jgi:multiple sugar transport system ATP-binding protein
LAEVELKNLWKVYGKDLIAVKNMNLKVKDKTLTAILGPSGAGKSSTLHMIAGIEKITHGDILFNGQSIKEFEPEELDVAMVFESYALYPKLTVKENIAHPLRAPQRAKNYTEDAIAKKVKEVAEILQIEQLLDRKPSQLSGGQRQRVAIGRALVRNPRVMLMDEPIGHLDAKLRNHMRGELRTLTHQLNTTIFYVTHDYKEAFAIADNIVVLNKGVIQQMGTPNEVFETPKNDFVANLVGDPPMNLLDTRIVEEGGEKHLVFEDVKIVFDEELSEQFNSLNLSNGTVRMGVRPIHVRMSDTKGPDTVPAEIYVVEPLGRNNIITFKVGENTLIQSVAEPTHKPEVGENTNLIFDKKYLFEPTMELESKSILI